MTWLLGLLGVVVAAIAALWALGRGHGIARGRAARVGRISRLWLQAEANFHRIHREYLHDDPPSTELGRLDAEFRARWRSERGLGHSGDLLLTPTGVVRRPAPDPA
jgi:hypothetical protein